MSDKKLPFAAVSAAFPPLVGHEPFIGALERGEVRSFAVVWVETPAAGGAARWSHSALAMDKPYMACLAMAVADRFRHDAVAPIESD